MKILTHGSLFSGIGGFDLAAEWIGWENRFHCEWNPFGQRILKHYWPNAATYTDITKTDFTIHRGTIDVLTGGFPCQPYSMAGKRKGKEDERHLWPEMLRAIREVQPRWVVGENVPGLVNWDGGLVFHEVQTDLEAEGYEVQPVILPACSVNAPHKRDRVWFVAYSHLHTNKPHRGEDRKADSLPQIHREKELRTGEPSRATGNDGANTPNSEDERLQGVGNSGEGPGKGYGIKEGGRPTGNLRTDWQDFPTEPPICTGDDGFPTELDGITLSKWRNESIKAGGNAIVPQVAFQIFQAIHQMTQAS